MLSPKENSRILDVGCGTGEMSLVFALGVPNSKVLGVDISNGSLSVAREKAEQAGASNASFENRDAFALGLQPESFDAVISSQVLGTQQQTRSALTGSSV